MSDVQEQKIYCMFGNVCEIRMDESTMNMDKWDIACDNCKYMHVEDYSEPCCHCTKNYAGDRQKLFFEPIFKDCDKSTEEKDNVNHPNHYTGKVECIDAMIETQGVDAVKNFCICNAFKYLWRHGKKNGLEDVKKAVWYLNKYIELEEDENEN